MNAQSPLTPHLSLVFTRWELRIWITGTIAIVLSLIGLVTNRAQFFHSYLFAWLFWTGLSFGALVLVMLQSLTGGQWGLAVRALAIAAFRTLPLMALLFLPILLGRHDIYGWSRGVVAEAGGYHHKAEYLSSAFFTGRTAFYFAVLIAFAVALRRGMENPRGSNVTALSAGGLITYVLCMNFASTDWVMSLNPQWYSTIFVEVFAIGQFLSALALVTLLLGLIACDDSLGRFIPTKAFHDLGNMLLAFVIFWTYVAFSQFLIIWSGNLPKEISWYLERSRGGWRWFAVLLAAVAFLLPFLLLLSRSAKRHRQRLTSIALVIVVANLLIDFWLVAPSFHPNGFYVHWLDLTELIALGAGWFALFLHFAKQRPLLPVEWTEATE